ncbi:glycosyltransferase family 2 protein [Streptomyces sp. NPDC090303]|uniref:glycosyltransferase family 2 protein n=1 Tax=Streptomyces sp. NPDC090303 TaxID=3365960 RepID=UPI003808C751
MTLASLVGFGCLTASQYLLLGATAVSWLLLPLSGFSLVYYLVSLRVNGFGGDFDVRAHRRLVRRWRPDAYPSVDVFLPVCGEPVSVLHNTWTHVRALADHYPGRCVPFVLDDSASPELAAMARDFGFRYGTRENAGWFKKAGNLHHGFGLTDGEFVLILDADFTPRADLLHELLPYFGTDPSIGIVQSPQYFRVLDAQNWVERGAGAVQELFYRSVQVSRQVNGGAICVGSCAVYRRTALEENGGTTLIEHSEDVHTGFDLSSLGWRLVYVPVAVSAGVCPDSVPAFVNQQYRWCTGSMSLLTSRKFWSARLSLTTRLCYVSGFLYYLHTALFTFAAPLVPVALLLLAPGLLRAEHLLLLVPGIVYAMLVFPLWHRSPYRLEAWAARMMYGWAHAFAIWDAVRGRRQQWRPTGANTAKGGRTRRFWWGMWGWSGGTAALWVGAALWRAATLDAADFALVLGSGLFYAVVVGRVLVEPRTEATP